MINDPSAANAAVSEAARLRALQRYRILDTMPEQDYDDLTALAAQICGTPMTTITFVDAERQWFKASIGLADRETSLQSSICARAIQSSAPMIIPDTLLDPRVADMPCVTGEPNIRFYAGIPLVTPDGFAIGTLTAMDHVPRTLTDAQLDALLILARQAMNVLEQRLQRDSLTAIAAHLGEAQRIAKIGSWELNVATGTLQWSDEIYRIFGVEASAFAGSFDAFMAFVHPDDRPAMQAAQSAALAGEPSLDLVHRIVRPDGAVRVVRERAQLLPPERDGGATTLAGTVQDITETEQAHADMLKRERDYRVMFESHPSPAWFYDASTLRFLAVNDAAEQVYGWSREEFLQMTLEQIRPSEDLELLRTRLGRQLQEFERESRWRHQTRDGTVMDVAIQSHAMTFEGRSARFVLVTDTTALREAQADARRNEVLLRLAAAAARLGGWAWDIDSGRLDLSQQVRELLDVPDGVRPSLDECLAFYTDESRPLIQEALQRCRREGISFDLELQLVSAGGRRFWGRAVGEGEKDETGRVVQIVGAFQDITERRKLEQQYLRAQRMESIGTLAGGIAHDLNNVLSPILLSIELLRSPMPSDELKETLDTLETSAKRGAGMVNQVLTFARGVDGRRMRIQPKTLLQEIARLAVDTFPRDIRVSVNADERLLAIEGDPTQLHQVLLNLAVNARDAMPGGGRLDLAGELVTIDAGSVHIGDEVQPGAFVLLRVEDSGTGISPEDLPRIFDPFFTTKEIGKGTGLGLATTHAIVRSHGGFVRVYSEPGRGTSFRIYLPVASAGEDAVEMEPERELPRGRGELVLVVDDEASVRQIARQTLEAFGYRVLLASDGAEAVALYASRGAEVDLVLTDMQMPVMDGVATIKVLRKLNPALRIIGASGLAANGSVAKAADAGVRHFLPKPYSARSLLDTVRLALEAMA